jgi:alkylhydroperoxidase family enzyme
MARIELPPGDEDELVRLYMISPKMGMAAGTFSDAIYNKSSLGTREREAARIRIAAINGCAVCLDTRTESTPETLSEDEYLGMETWAELTTLSDRERLAAEFAERFALDHQQMDDDLWERLHAAYSDKEIFDLAMSVAGWLALGRITAVFGAGVACPIRY